MADTNASKLATQIVQTQALMYLQVAVLAELLIAHTQKINLSLEGSRTAHQCNTSASKLTCLVAAIYLSHSRMAS